MMHRYLTHPALALGSTLLWGIIELIALLRSYRAGHDWRAIDAEARGRQGHGAD